MGIEIRVPDDDDVEALFHADARAFGFHYPPERIAEQLTIIDLSRYRIALDGDEVVGVIGSYAMDVTVPGGATMPMGAVTWVGVAATHRRQGCPAAVDGCVPRRHRRARRAGGDAVRQRGRDLRAVRLRRWRHGLWLVEIDTREAAPATRARAAAGHACASSRGDDAAEHVAATWERYRRTRPGETSRTRRRCAPCDISTARGSVMAIRRPGSSLTTTATPCTASSALERRPSGARPAVAGDRRGHARRPRRPVARAAEHRSRRHDHAAASSRSTIRCRTC